MGVRGPGSRVPPRSPVNKNHIKGQKSCHLHTTVVNVLMSFILLLKFFHNGILSLSFERKREKIPNVPDM